jgi:magnesium transporter
MTTEYISLTRDITVEQAVERVRKLAKEKETIYTLFVTDSSKKLEGVLSFKELLLADAAALIEDVMNKAVIKVSTDTGQQEAARTMQELDLLAVPVVDKEYRLVGIVTIDDAMDILEDEAADYIYEQAGIVAGKEASRSEVLIRGNLWAIWRVRLPFLFITIIGGMLAAMIMGGFEEVLESIAAVAFFIPLIMDMGGTIGTQSSTVFARGVALGHIDIKAFFRPFIKEVGTGLSIGAISGVISGIVAAILQGMPMLGLAVGIAVATTMTLAALLGFLVPYLLIRLNVDQAAGSAPIITSIKDISGLLVYFAVVSILLGHLM